MVTLNKTFRLLSRTIMLTLLVGLVWIFSLPAFSAVADSDRPLGSANYRDTNLAAGDNNISQARKDRIEAVGDCRNYLAKGDKNSVAHLDKPLDRSGSKTLVGALKVTDNPEPTVAEVEFKRCLEEKGIAPKP